MEPIYHQHTKEQINKFIDQPSHGLCIVGETGAGKGYAAQDIASKLLGTTIEKLVSYPYLKTLACNDAQVGIEEIRESQNFLSLVVPGKRLVRRILILENIDGLGREAQNALLKTLEETPADSVIIATAARTDRVLPTIHSRLQHIALRPVDLTQAEACFGAKYPSSVIKKMYLISGGYMGLMTAILTSAEDHPLAKAIAQAKQILGQTRYERLLNVDKLVKDRDSSSTTLLDGLYRLLHASYKQGVLKGRSHKELSISLRRMNMVDSAGRDLESKVSEKLVLSRLLYEL